MVNPFYLFCDIVYDLQRKSKLSSHYSASHERIISAPVASTTTPVPSGMSSVWASTTGCSTGFSPVREHDDISAICYRFIYPAYFWPL